ncbi:MAG: signal peptidase II [Candidatus Methylomirabilales bacterium]
MAALLLLIVSILRASLASPATSGIVIGGGAANLADRALGRTVVDLIDLGWWPTFNLADVFIVTGVGLLLLKGILGSDRDRRDAESLSGSAASSGRPGTSRTNPWSASVSTSSRSRSWFSARQAHHRRRPCNAVLIADSAETRLSNYLSVSVLLGFGQSAVRLEVG